MRSRYAAYALGLTDYLIDTTHPASPHRQPDRAAWRSHLDAYCREIRFEKLEVVSVESPEDPSTGWVTFRAHLFHGTRDASFTEKSLFRKEGSHWLYVSGIQVG